MKYPSVLRNAETEPSAKRETISPMCRKVPEPSSSPIFLIFLVDKESYNKSINSMGYTPPLQIQPATRKSCRNTKSVPITQFG